jgi:hypothetical protein
VSVLSIARTLELLALLELAILPARMSPNSDESGFLVINSVEIHHPSIARRGAASENRLVVVVQRKVVDIGRILVTFEARN